MMDTIPEFRKDFLRFILKCNALRIGDFTTKSGHPTTYFFDTGLINDGQKLRQLGRFYVDAMIHSGIICDQLFGIAYKGIPLVAATAIATAERLFPMPWSFNRKKEKTHGEGGIIIGTPLHGRVMIIDDVLTRGDSKIEAIKIIRDHGATPAAILVALDRMEHGNYNMTVAEEIESVHKIPVISIATFKDLVLFQGINNEYR